MTDKPRFSALAADPVGRRERKRQQTADHIADVAWSLFEAQGFPAVTMEAIAAAADVAKGTLYKHFPVKEALLRHRFHGELAAALPELLADLAKLPSAAERLRAFLRVSAAWSEAHRAYLKDYIHFRLAETGALEGREPQRRSGFDRIFQGFLAAGQATGEFRGDADPAHLAHYLEFLQLAAVLRWLGDPALRLDDEYGRMLDLFLNGLRSPQ